MELMISDDADAAARRCAALFAEVAERATAERERFVAALSGGRTPRPLHRLLGAPPFSDRIPWDRTDLFWADERMVPPEDAASNFGAARKDLIDFVPMAAARVHPMPTDSDPQAAAVAYQRRIAKILGLSPAFDVVMLGLGSDGHTASLFPECSKPVDPDAWVLSVAGGTPPVPRLTLTPPLINRSRCVCFFVTGVDKADAVRQVLADRNPGLPATWIRPARGRLLWILDRAAASKIEEK
jgi:6-phosphogluconolactonase